MSTYEHTPTKSSGSSKTSMSSKTSKASGLSSSKMSTYEHTPTKSSDSSKTSMSSKTSKASGLSSSKMYAYEHAPTKSSGSNKTSMSSKTSKASGLGSSKMSAYEHTPTKSSGSNKTSTSSKTTKALNLGKGSYVDNTLSKSSGPSKTSTSVKTTKTTGVSSTKASTSDHAAQVGSTKSTTKPSSSSSSYAAKKLALIKSTLQALVDVDKSYMSSYSKPSSSSSTYSSSSYSKPSTSSTSYNSSSYSKPSSSSSTYSSSSYSKPSSSYSSGWGSGSSSYSSYKPSSSYSSYSSSSSSSSTKDWGTGNLEWSYAGGNTYSGGVKGNLDSGMWGWGGVPIDNPVALDLNGDGAIGVTGATASFQKDLHAQVGRTVRFDIDGDGKLDTIEWYNGSGDGILIDNRDGQAANDMSGKRLFGDEGGKRPHGYIKLEEFDANGDGVLSGEELKGIELWVDNGDAIVQEGEIQTLAAHGVAEIATAMTLVVDEEGRTHMQSTATRTDGSTVLTEDVWFINADKLPAATEVVGDDASVDVLLGESAPQDAAVKQALDVMVEARDEVVELLRKIVSAQGAQAAAA